MTPRATTLCCAALLALVAGALALPAGQAQTAVQMIDPAAAPAELARAMRESKAAAARAARFSAAAQQASEAATRTASEAAALAAQVQQAEAEIEAAAARFAIAQGARAALTARLAQKQEPMARLMAALQMAARRPLALSALQPGSLKDVVHVPAVLGSAVPQIRARTAGLRAELEQGRALELAAARSLEELCGSEVDLRTRRQQLAALEASQRLASRSARGNPLREEERALALAEQARDLDGLVATLDRHASLRRELAALPGPVLRPDNLENSVAAAPSQAAPVAASSPIAAPQLQLPVTGRTLAGFGALRASGQRSTGIMLTPAAGAQVVAPAAGRIAFAGPYRGFGEIVIIEHDGGWASVVTGLARIDAAIGQSVMGGSPIGVAGQHDTAITIELRRDGEPVNPLQFVG